MKNPAKKSETLDTINLRVGFIMTHLRYDEVSFARKVGVSKSAINSVVTGKEDPSFALIKNICSIFPVSREWMFIGKGNPFTSKELKPYFSDSETHGDHRDVNSEINSRIKAIRMALDYSQAIFAGELNVSRDVITSIETFRTSPSSTLIHRIALKYGVPPDWMVLGRGHMSLKK